MTPNISKSSLNNQHYHYNMCLKDKGLRYPQETQLNNAEQHQQIHADIVKIKSVLTQSPAVHYE